MKLNRLWSVRWGSRAALPLIWIALGLIFSAQLYIFANITGWNTTWGFVLRWELTRWCLWAVLWPFITKIIRRYPWQRPYSSRFLTHLGACLATAFVHVILFVTFHLLIGSTIDAWSQNISFANALQQTIHRDGSLSNIFVFTFAIDFHFGVFVYWAILVLITTFGLYRRAAQLKLELTRAQLQALKMQIHPHFLFNTLNSISALLHKDPQAADEMVGGLGDFLRLTLKSSGKEMVRLEKEMEFLRCYMEIEQVRFRDQLSVDFQVGPDSADAEVPNMLFQPIIENAVKHGMSDRKDRGAIQVFSEIREGRLLVRISDNGPGIAMDQENTKEGIGLRNVRQRLQQIYHNDYRFIMENGEECGLRVTVEIPYRRMKADTEEWE